MKNIVKRKRENMSLAYYLGLAANCSTRDYYCVVYLKANIR